MSRRMWRIYRRNVVRQIGKSFSTDLGGSSNYNVENHIELKLKMVSDEEQFDPSESILKDLLNTIKSEMDYKF